MHQIHHEKYTLKITKRSVAHSENTATAAAAANYKIKIAV